MREEGEDEQSDEQLETTSPTRTLVHGRFEYRNTHLHTHTHTHTHT